MLPRLLLSAGIIITLVLANLLPKAGAEPGSLQTDDRGFINTAARCDTAKSAIAVGRTQQSLVAICVDGNGHYEYRGVRLKDNSVLNVPGAVLSSGKYVVHNGDVIYVFSAKELMIIRGWGWVVRKEPMVAYVEPRLPAGG
jgi:hypothetical protein